MIKIFLVEDSKFLRLATERALARAGYNMTSAADADEALHLAREILPDLILLDMLLPKLSGPDVLKALKKDPATKAIRVVVMSGMSQKNAARLQHDGAIGSLKNPLLSWIRVPKNCSSLSKRYSRIFHPPRLEPPPHKRLFGNSIGLPLGISHLSPGTLSPRPESIPVKRHKTLTDRLAEDFSVQDGVENPIIRGRLRMAGATTLADLASAIGARAEEAAIVADLKAGSETAYAWLIGEFQRPVYGLVYRMVSDPADAADTTQDVFLKVFRGMKHFHGESSLKTWIYRIALHESANRKRWWFRHKAHETSIEPVESEVAGNGDEALQSALTDHHDSPFDNVAHRELQQRVDAELRRVAEPYRTTLILRDLEEMSYEEIAEILQISLGTVKSRLTRGRQALKKRLAPYVREVGEELGLALPEEQERENEAADARRPVAGGGRRVEVMP